MRNAITVREAQNLLQQHGMVLKFDGDEFCVNYRHGGEGTAEYSYDLEEVIAVGIRKAQAREAKEVGRRNKASEHRAMS